MRALQGLVSWASTQFLRPASASPLRPSRAAGRIAAAGLLVGMSLGIATAAQAKPFMEYLKPTPIVDPLSSDTWGESGVVPRDLSNGIESVKGKGVHPEYYYWDGQIVRAKDGKYHMFMSTFSGNTNFGTSWQGSDAYHAISETNVLGPYKRQDFVYTNNGSHKGHNVSAVELPDGTYAVIVSEIVPFTIYTSSSLDGPWKGCSPSTDIGASNISLFPRHDGKFQITERNGTIAIADTLCGAYKKQKPTCSYTQNATDSVYPKRTSIPGVSNPSYQWQEDPHIWRSGGTYHIIYSGSGDRVGWHVYSADGLTWKDNGYAWSPRDYKKIFCYEDSTTCSAWYKMERPGVVLEDGHPTHITWAVSDVDKDNQVTPGTNHGTKVVVVAFDGVAFDADFGTGSPSGTGGSTGAGGATGKPDAGSAGGATGAGGKSGVDGGGATGGSSGASGGTSGSGGISGSGGTSSSSKGSGGVGAGGSSATSGGHGGSIASGTGGASGLGGATSGSGGSSSSVAGSGGSTTHTSTPGDNDSSGCNCNLGSASHNGVATASLFLVALGMLLRRRRSR
jgi:MYXO-CTERM domain-containing protein